MIYNKSKYNQQWSTKRLSELGVFSRGKSKHRPRNDERLFEGGGYPLVQTGDIKDANLYITKHTQEYGEFGLKQSKLWDTETLCITIAANIAETALLSYPMCFPDSVVGFRAFKETSSEKFMYYVFSYIRQAIKNAASGSIQDNINIKYLTSLYFKVPSKKIQDNIVSILSCIDEKLLINQQINDNLQKQLCLIYENMMRNAQYGSVEGTFTIASKLTDVLTGKEDANFASSKGKYKFFTCSNDTLNCNEYVFDNSAIMIAGNGDFNVKHYSGKFNAYQRTYVLIPNHKYYGLLYLASLYQINSFKSASSGSIVKFVTKGDIENISVFVPKDERILNELNRLLVLQENNQLENEELSSLRDWLLPMLMNGQATIED